MITDIKDASNASWTTEDPYAGLSILEIKRLQYPRWAHTIAGLTLLCIGIFGFFENCMVMFTFYKSKNLRTATNTFIIGVCVSDMCMVMLGNPLAWTSALNGGWFAGTFMCYWEGFVVYTFGLASMYLLTAVSFDRYIVIAKPLKASMITKRVAALAVVGCFLFGMLWSIPPFFGWGKYGLEAPGVFCGLLWETPTFANRSYITAIFFACFVFPVFIMLYSYYHVYMTIHNVNKNTVWDMKSRVARKNLRIEKRMLKSCVIMCVTFWLCWTPYSVVSFWQTFGDHDAIPLALTEIPAVAAKSQVVWNPIIYVATNKQFRKAFYEALPCTGLREKLIKKEEEAKEQSSKESDLDSKKQQDTQIDTRDKQTEATEVTHVTNRIAVAPAPENGPTKVDC